MTAISKLFDRLLEKGGSDLHLSPGYPPMLRLRGQLTADGDKALSSADIEALFSDPAAFRTWAEAWRRRAEAEARDMRGR